MSTKEVEATLLEDIRLAGNKDPDDAVRELAGQDRATEAQVRDAIVSLVDRHELTFTTDCKLAVPER